MPNENIGILREYRAKKTVLKKYNFIVNFDVDGVNETSIIKTIGKMPDIKPYHILSITVPDFKFNSEHLLYGSFPKSFPLITKDAFVVRMEMEEDEFGTVSRFIEWLKKRNMNEDGINMPPNQSKIKTVICDVLDDTGLTIMRFYYRDMFFLQADPISFLYSEGSQLIYTISFSCDSLLRDFRYGNPPKKD